MENNYAIQTNNLSIHYGNFTAVKGVNIKVERQKITAIIGPSGAGKSTLLKCLNRLIDLTPNLRVTGAVTFHGENIFARGTDADALRAVTLGAAYTLPQGGTVSSQGMTKGTINQDRKSVV